MTDIAGRPEQSTELLRRLGRSDEALAEYERALELVRAEPERRFLQRRVVEVSA